jgi:nitroreductase
MIIEKKAKTQYPINDLIEKRWSIRAFDPDKQVTKEQILSLCEAARWAPSCANEQSWYFIILDKFTNIDSWQKGLNCLTERNQLWVKNAPVVIIALSAEKFRANSLINNWTKFDTGAACMNIYLQAISMGLAAHPMAGFDAEKIRINLNIPENISPTAVIAIGYQTDYEILNETFHKQEKSERTRLPLNNNFFDGEWEKPIIE